jgi:hypothetical protein
MTDNAIMDNPNFEDVVPDKRGYWKKWGRELTGTPTEYGKEAFTNSDEYTTDIPNIVCGIIPTNIEESKCIFYILDNGDGIEAQFWDDYRVKLNAHINPKGILGIFGEGVRKAGLSASIEQPKILVTRTKAIGESEKYAIFAFDATEDNENFKCSQNISDLPSWVDIALRILPIGEHGTQQFILTKTPYIVDFKEIMQFFMAQSIRNKHTGISLVYHNRDGTEKKRYKLFAPTYNAKKPIDYWTTKINGVTINITGFVECSSSETHIKGLKVGEIPANGATIYYVNGMKVKYLRGRRDDVIVEVDMTKCVDFIKGILGNKDDVNNIVYEEFCKPIEEAIIERYKERQEGNVDEKSKKLTDSIIEKLQKNFEKSNKNKVGGNEEQDDKIRRKDKEYNFWCNNCKRNFKDKDRNITVCKLCGSLDIKYLPTNNTENPDPKKRKPRGGTSVFESQHRPFGGESFVLFSFINMEIIFDTDYKLHKKCDEYKAERSEEIYKAFISLILQLWNSKKIRYDEDQTEILKLQLTRLAEDYNI